MKHDFFLLKYYDVQLNKAIRVKWVGFREERKFGSKEIELLTYMYNDLKTEILTI